MATTRDNNNGGRSNSSSGNSGKGKQGFASMPEDKQREIASKGGRASHGGRSSSGSDSDDES